MPEVVIKYQKAETLKVLKSLGKYLGFNITSKKDIATQIENNVTIIPGDKDISIDDLTNLFTSKNLDAAQLRKTAWQRNL